MAETTQRRWRIVVAILLCLGASMAVEPARAQKPNAVPVQPAKPEPKLPTLRLEAAIPVKASDAGWGGIAVDEAGRRLFLAHRASGVSVFNIDTLKPLADIQEAKGAVAVALAPGLGSAAGRGFSANGDADAKSVTVFDLASYRVLGTVALEAPPVRMVYDAGSQQVILLTMNGQSARLVYIDGNKMQIVATTDLQTVQVGGMTSDGAGRLFVAVPERDSIAVFNLISHEALGTWPTGTCRQPGEMALDRTAFRLAVVCKGTPGITALIDIMSGRVAASVRSSNQPTRIVIEPRERLMYFLSGPEQTLAVAQAKGVERYEALELVTTRPNAGEAAVDPRTGRLFVVSADMTRPVSALGEATAPMRVIPNSLTFLIYRRLPIEP